MSETAFFNACNNGNIKEVIRLLKTDIDINKPYLERTPFFAACENGHYEIVKLLMDDNRIQVNQTVAEQSGLFIACCNGHEKIVALLLSDIRVDVNKGNELGCTPFFAACNQAKIAIIKLFLQNPRVDVNREDRKSRTPFAQACQRGDLEIIELLLTNERIYSNKTDSYGKAPFALICGEQDKITDLFFVKALKAQPELLDKPISANMLNSLLKEVGFSTGHQCAYETPKGIFLKSKYSYDRKYMNFAPTLTRAVVIAKRSLFLGSLKRGFESSSSKTIESSSSVLPLYTTLHANKPSPAEERVNYIKLISAAAQICKTQIETPVTSDIRRYLPPRTERHANGLARCKTIIANAELLLANTVFCQEEKPLTDSFVNQLEAIISSLKESATEGGLLLKSNASLNTHLIELYDKNSVIFTADTSRKNSAEKITCVIKKLELMKADLVPEKKNDKQLLTMSVKN